MSSESLLKLIEEAKAEIREDDARKTQSLQLFREWLDKHPFIKRCRRDDIFLLQFLRTRKYSLNDVHACFEKHLILREKRPEWFDASPARIEIIKDLVSNGFVYKLPERSSNGETVFVINAGKFNHDKYGSDEAFGATFSSSGIIFEDEVSQIMGLYFVLDFTDADKRYFGFGTPKTLYDWGTSLEGLPGRYRKIFIIGLPSLHYTLLNIARMSMSEKMRNRLHMLKEASELADHISPKVLPEKFGGLKAESEAIDHYMGLIDEYAAKQRDSNDLDIDFVAMTKAREEEGVDGNVGSFRKLEID